MDQMVEQAAHRRGARLGIFERKEIVLDQPDQMRQRHHQRDRDRHIGPWRAKRRARVAVEQQKQRERGRQHHDEILRPQRQPAREPEQAPVAQPPAAQRAMEGKAGERPERELDHVVIELGRGEIEIVQAVDDQHGGERTGGADEPPRQNPHQRKGGEHRDLGNQVVDRVDPDQPIRDLDQPPGKRRQLVVAELPFPAIGQRLDQVERQVGVKRAWQRGPQHGMQQRKGRKARARPVLQAVEQARDHRQAGRAGMPGRLARVVAVILRPIIRRHDACFGLHRHVKVWGAQGQASGVRGGAGRRDARGELRMGVTALASRPIERKHAAVAGRIAAGRGVPDTRHGELLMGRLSAIFVTICMILIAGAIGAVLYLQFGLSGPEAAIITLVALTSLALVNAVTTRQPGSDDVVRQLSELSRVSIEAHRQLGELSRRVSAIEGKTQAAVETTLAATQPIKAEIGEVGGLIKQIAEAVAVHDTQLRVLTPSAGASAAVPPEVPPVTQTPPAVPAAPLAETAAARPQPRPHDAKPSESKPYGFRLFGSRSDESKPAEFKPSADRLPDVKPATMGSPPELKPSAPLEIKTVETKSPESKSPESKSLGSKSLGSKSLGSNPPESKAPEFRPLEPKPVEARLDDGSDVGPPEAKPIETQAAPPVTGEPAPSAPKLPKAVPLGSIDAKATEPKPFEAAPAESRAYEPRPTQTPPVDAVAGRPSGGRFKDMDSAAIAQLVREAVDANRVDLFLQPIVTLPQRKVRYYEAVARLRAGDGEQLMAADFLAHAEAAGLMPRIDNLMLQRCVQVVRRLLAKNREIGLFCNISTSTLVDATTSQQFTEFMEANKAIAPALVFEFTQAALRAMGTIENESLGALAQLGYRFSLDNVTDLRIEPRDLAERGFRFVKVQAGLLLNRAGAVTDIHPQDFAGLLSRFGVELVAAKIESESAVVDLLDYDVKFGQGFLFSPPRPVRPEVMQGISSDVVAREGGDGAPPAQPAGASSSSTRLSSLAQLARGVVARS